MGVVGIIVSLLLLIYLAYRGITVLILAPLLALLAALLNGGTPLLATYTEVFMKNFAAYAKAFFPLFLLGAIFGRIMDDSGCARTIAVWTADRIGGRHSILAIVLACAILTYGGVSLFVVAFAVYPIAVAMFREADIPKRLIPGSIALGSFTFTMTALPGTPQIQNSIPMPYFGTTIYAAPIIGSVCGALMLVMGMLWLKRRARSAREKGEGYGRHADGQETQRDDKPVPQPLVAFLPILLVLVLNYVLTNYAFPAFRNDYLAHEPYNTKIEKVVGIWSIIVSVSTACFVALVMNWKRMTNPVKTINQGAYGSLLAIVNTCSEVGYGNVIASLGSFEVIKHAIFGLSSNVLVSESIGISSLAMITGSASGGLSIALGALGETYLKLAHQAGIAPAVLHRIATIACSAFDTLPHNGAVITLLAVCHLTHRESYIDIGIVSGLVPALTLVVGIALASFGVA